MPEIEIAILAELDAGIPPNGVAEKLGLPIFQVLKVKKAAAK